MIEDTKKNMIKKYQKNKKNQKKQNQKNKTKASTGNTQNLFQLHCQGITPGCNKGHQTMTIFMHSNPTGPPGQQLNPTPGPSHVHTSTHALTHSPTHSRTHALTHSLTHVRFQKCCVVSMQVRINDVKFMFHAMSIQTPQLTNFKMPNNRNTHTHIHIHTSLLTMSQIIFSKHSPTQSFVTISRRRGAASHSSQPPLHFGMRYHLTDVPPQPNSPPDNVFRTNQTSKETTLKPSPTPRWCCLGRGRCWQPWKQKPSAFLFFFFFTFFHFNSAAFCNFRLNCTCE